MAVSTSLALRIKIFSLDDMTQTQGYIIRENLGRLMGQSPGNRERIFVSPRRLHM
jgi:hypothetical protein